MQHQQAVTALSAIAHEGRLAIFRLLVQSASDIAAGDIAQQLSIPSSTLSFHLKALQQAGLIVSRQEGRFLYYSPARDEFANLLAYLTDNCCGGAGCPVTDKGETVCQN
jgi:DNA-binding transcriptional ArsR family regulator